MHSFIFLSNTEQQRVIIYQQNLPHPTRQPWRCQPWRCQPWTTQPYAKQSVEAEPFTSPGGCGSGFWAAPYVSNARLVISAATPVVILASESVEIGGISHASRHNLLSQYRMICNRSCATVEFKLNWLEGCFCCKTDPVPVHLVHYLSSHHFQDGTKMRKHGPWYQVHLIDKSLSPTYDVCFIPRIALPPKIENGARNWEMAITVKSSPDFHQKLKYTTNNKNYQHWARMHEANHNHG